jgi:hypothetical protein
VFSSEETIRTVGTKDLVRELKELFAAHLSEADRLKKPEGVATGIEAFDRFLVWGGIPKGALSLLCGTLGSGVTSLWLEAAARVVQSGRWVAWINQEVPLSPLSLHHKGVDLARFVAIEPPSGDAKKMLWLLQELISSSLFELIGCDLGALNLREHQVRKLQAQARNAHVALVFLSTRKPLRGAIASMFSLIVNFEKRRILIERATHRPTPHAIPRSVNYARFTLHTGDRIGLGTNSLSTPERADRKPDSLLKTARASVGGI